MRIRRKIKEHRILSAHGKAKPLEHWNAEVTSLRKVQQDGLRTSGIAVGMKDHGGVNPKVKRSSIGPCDGRHFLSRIAASAPIKQLALSACDHREVPGFLQKVAGIGESCFVDKQHTVADHEAIQKTSLGED